MVGLQFLFLEPYVLSPLLFSRFTGRCHKSKMLMNSNPDDPLNKGMSYKSQEQQWNTRSEKAELTF